jgi:hypothetical protein
MDKLGLGALRRAGGDGARAEALFERYLSRVADRLEACNTRFGVEWQPAALRDGTRVPNFIHYEPVGGTKLYAYPGSRRLDAGIVDLSSVRSGYHPVIHGFDLTVDLTKPNVVGYYQEYFGPIPINDIRLPQ